MTMGIPEEAGKVATSAVEGLKNNPSCLAAICLAGLFAVLTFVALQSNERRASEARLQMMQLLAACYPSSGVQPPIYPPRANRRDEP